MKNYEEAKSSYMGAEYVFSSSLSMRSEKKAVVYKL